MKTKELTPFELYQRSEEEVANRAASGDMAAQAVQLARDTVRLMIRTARDKSTAEKARPVRCSVSKSVQLIFTPRPGVGVDMAIDARNVSVNAIRAAWPAIETWQRLLDEWQPQEVELTDTDVLLRVYVMKTVEGLTNAAIAKRLNAEVLKYCKEYVDGERIVKAELEGQDFPLRLSMTQLLTRCPHLLCRAKAERLCTTLGMSYADAEACFDYRVELLREGSKIMPAEKEAPITREMVRSRLRWWEHKNAAFLRTLTASTSR